MEKLNKFQKIFYRIYYFVFIERFTKKIDFNFQNKGTYRWDLINALHSKYNFKSYLEIGCDQNQLFSKIKIENKIGVDPYSGGTIRMKSDDFFKKNEKFFDCIFIDGLHVYDQVKKDILNSLKFLNESGFILVHDCLPGSLSSQAVPRYKMVWHGDVWKAIVDLRGEKNLEIFTCEIDSGISIIQKKKNTDLLVLDKKAKKLKFKDFYENYKKYMRTISFDEVKNKF